jgi:hypothetical protein
MDHYGNCPRALMVCPDCPRSARSQGVLIDNDLTIKNASDYEDWMKTLHCVLCNTTWHICTLCMCMRSHLKNYKMLRLHYRLRHREEIIVRKRKERSVSRIDIPRQFSNTKTNQRTSKCLQSPADDFSFPEDFSFPADDFSLAENNTLEAVEERNSNNNCFLEVTTNEIATPIVNALGTVQNKKPAPAPTWENSLFKRPKISDAASKFDNPNSSFFFEKETTIPGGGGRHLVAQSFYKGDRKVEDLKDDDVDICLQMTLLVQSLSLRQNKLLGNFLDLLFQKIEKIRVANVQKDMQNHFGRGCPSCACELCRLAKEEPPPLPQVVDMPTLPPIPTTYGRIRSVILEGAKSFIPMLAHPKIKNIGSHSYVLPSQCIKHYLASGNLPMLFDTIIGPEIYLAPKDTPRGIAIASKLKSDAQDISPRHLAISFVEWKDDCESSKSNKASKTGSIWVWTMTIFGKEKKQDSPLATFPIAIGLKSDSHERVEGIIGKDLQWMANNRIPAFIGGVGEPQEVTFSAEMFLSLGDQPERRSGNKLMAGNSRAHTRWRIVADHVKLQHVLPACEDCWEAMNLANIGAGNDWIRTSRECTVCTNWMAGGLDSPLLAYQPAATFPKGFLLGGEETTNVDKMVYPIELNYEILKKVVTTAHQKLAVGEWSPSVAKTFLKENGIKEDYRNFIIRRGGNCGTLVLAREKAGRDRSTDEDRARLEKIEADRNRCPLK